MSHFSVAVFTEPWKMVSSRASIFIPGDTVEELLAPFHEFECTGTVDEYVQSIDQLAEVREEYEKDTEARLKSPDGTLYDKYNDQFFRETTDEDGRQSKTHFIPDGFEEVEIKTSDIKSFRDFVEDRYEREVLFEGEEPDINDKHKWGWMCLNSEGEVIELIDRTNPDKRWDWWAFGGRWNGMLLIKEDADGDTGELGAFGHRHEKETPAPTGYKWVDSAKVKDICWDKMTEITKKEREKHWEEAENEKNPAMRYFKYGIEKDMTKEQYIAAAGTFSTFAAVTPDGKWHEKGNMGWWACVSDEKENWTESYYDAFLKNADPELTLTIVDCHI